MPMREGHNRRRTDTNPYCGEDSETGERGGEARAAGSNVWRVTNGDGCSRRV
jgi:hypothetical protein